MNRFRIFIAAAVILVALAAVALRDTSNGDLARKKVRVGKQRVLLRIYEEEGQVWASTEELPPLFSLGIVATYGSSSTLGRPAEIGIEGAAITATDQPGVYKFQVGTASGTFDVNQRGLSVNPRRREE